MKTSRLFAAAAVLALGLLAACTQKPATVQTTNYVRNDTALLVPDQPYCITIDLDIDFPTAYENEEALALMQKNLAVSLFDEENYAEMPIQEAIEQYVDLLITEYMHSNEGIADDFEDAFFLNNAYVMEGRVAFENEHFLGYEIFHYAYTGGAHGMSWRDLINFDKTTGNRVEEEDLFVGNYEDGLAERLVNSLMRQEGVQTVEDLKNASYFVDEIKPNGNFRISDRGITYCFPPYEIAPYARGIVNIDLSPEDLAGLLKEDMASRFAQ